MILKKKQVSKAFRQIDLLSNKIKGVRVRHQRAEEQNNEIFKKHLEMELSTLEGVLCAYHRFIASRRRDLQELIQQIFDLQDDLDMLHNDLMSLKIEVEDSDSDESDYDESDEFECDHSESDESESDEIKCDDSESDKIADLSERMDKLYT